MCAFRNFAILKFCIELTEVTWFDKAMIKVGGRSMIACSLCPADKNKPPLGFITEQIFHTVEP